MKRGVEVAILGAGTVGLSALSEVKKITNDFVLIDSGPLGTTCARTGCMPSKALIQIANDFHLRHRFSERGIDGGDDLRLSSRQALGFVRSLRDQFARGGMGPLGAELAQALSRLGVRVSCFTSTPNLASLGRRPNTETLGLEAIGVELDQNGVPKFDPRTGQLEGFPIFIAGDASRDRPVLHEAVFAGHGSGASWPRRFKINRRPLSRSFVKLSSQKEWLE